MNIGLLVGSLRKASFNKKIAHVLIRLAPKSMNMNIIDIGQLSLFNQDDEAKPPQAWVDFRDAIKPMDGFIFITPEYNRSLPAVIKNALDIGSRPYGENLWDKKPCAIVSASIGSMGGFGANHHLRQCMVFLNMPCMQQPEVYLSFVDKLFDENGEMNNEGTQSFLSGFIQAFEQWVHTHQMP